MDLLLIRNALIAILILIPSLTIHEWAHAFTADKMGDPTPKDQERITLNPLSHIDLFGSIVIPLLMITLNPAFKVLGWGKPVITNPKNYKYYRVGDIIVSLAGPIANIVVAILCSFIGGYIAEFLPNFRELFSQIVIINVSLAIFNMIPIPPLDGSHIMKHLFSISEETFSQWAGWGGFIIILLINFNFFIQFISKWIISISFFIMKIGSL